MFHVSERCRSLTLVIFESLKVELPAESSAQLSVVYRSYLPLSESRRSMPSVI